MKITNNNTAEKNESVARKPLVEMAETDHVQSKPLTPAETEHLAKCEETIGKGIKTFKEVADALQDIRDQQLYRKKHKTFEEYCRNKWKFTARHANRLMQAREVVENLKSDQLVSNEPLATPENEAQARMLVNLKPEQQVEVCKKVAKKTNKPTAKDFDDEAKKLYEDKPRVQCYDSRDEEAPGDKKTAKESNEVAKSEAVDKDELEKLVELVDHAQTQAKKIKDGEVWAKQLGDLAKEITKRMNGGAK